MDQAKKLREMMDSLGEGKETKDSNKNIKKSKKQGSVISISSGKGGVGKTNFALNLSIALRQLSYDVIVIDADIGLGNVEIMSGINLKYSISDMINLDMEIEDIIGIGPNDIRIISGGSGIKELVLFNEKNFEKLLKQLDKLQREYDYIIIDTGAGISSSVLDFIMASDGVIVVSTSDPTSIMDAYILIKSILMKGFKGQIDLISNSVKNSNHGKDVYFKINNASKKFLKTNVNYLGYILKDDKIPESIARQIPLLLNYPNRITTRQIKTIARNLVENKKDFHREEAGFAEKLLNIFMK